jgi:hypothetical protein
VYREAFQDKAVEQGKNGSRGADPEAHHQDHGDGKAGTVHNGAHRVSNIAPRAFEPWCDPHRTRVLAGERHIAHGAQTCLMGISAIQPSAFQALGLHRAVEFNFLRQLSVDTPLPQEVCDASE